MVVRFIVGLTILSYACYTDVRTRHASNYLWLLMGVVGSLLLLLQYVTVGFDNVLILSVIPMMFILSYVIFQSGLLFAGADTKALMSLSILVPFYVVNVFLLSILFILLVIPFLLLYYHKKYSVLYLMTKYRYPFMVNILFGFLFTFAFGNVINVWDW